MVIRAEASGAEAAVFTLKRGNSPLLVSMPHVGTRLPEWLVPRLTEAGLALSDTDWYLEALYDFLENLDATVIIARYSRYVIDLNRPVDDASLYPGQSVTGLCPVDTFAGAPIYLEHALPTPDEVQQRVRRFWAPYHQALAEELSRIKALHGRAMLWDAHSIRSEVPRFFEGQLPHLNIGTADNQACTPELTEKVAAAARCAGNYEWVVNGRFKGGYITRAYGRPQAGVDAVQLEIAMRSYMDESGPVPSPLDESKAQRLRPVIKAMMQSLLQ